MRITVLLSFLVVCFFSISGEEWNFVGITNENDSIFVHTDIMEKDNGNFLIWQMHVKSEETEKVLVQYDINNCRASVLEIVTYDKIGKLLNSICVDEEKRIWTFVAPGTIGYSMIEIARKVQGVPGKSYIPICY